MGGGSGTLWRGKSGSRAVVTIDVAVQRTDMAVGWQPVITLRRTSTDGQAVTKHVPRNSCNYYRQSCCRKSLFYVPTAMAFANASYVPTAWPSLRVHTLGILALKILRKSAQYFCVGFSDGCIKSHR